MNASIKLAKEVGANIVRCLFLADIPSLKGVENLNIPLENIAIMIHLS
jgi:hypothetical protein